MKTTARLAVLSTVLMLATGCTGGHLRHNRDKARNDPVQLPTAPTLDKGGMGAGSGATTPSSAPFSPFGANMQDASPSPLSSNQPAAR